VFGGDWQEAGIYAFLSAPMFLTGFMVQPATQTLLTLEKAQVQFLWDTLRAVLTLGAMLTAVLLSQPPRVVILAYTLAMCVSYVVLFVLVDRIARRPGDVNTGDVHGPADKTE
jgi:O-antigen/teichoic acid export membrane protein